MDENFPQLFLTLQLEQPKWQEKENWQDTYELD